VRFPLQIRLSAIKVPTTEAAPQHRKKVTIRAIGIAGKLTYFLAVFWHLFK
jgi:hypothetical protein